MGSICVTGDYVLTMDPRMPLVRNGGVVLEDGEVVSVGRAEEVIDAHRPELVVGGRWRLVMPGLIDAHVHTRERLAAFLFPDTVTVRRVDEEVRDALPRFARRGGREGLR
jgi:5-methylthioadenosine/S-adenosylhomocysteine deaminase